MSSIDNARRTLLAGAAAALALPGTLRAQPAPVKIGLVHPVSGALAFPGQQCRIGAQMAVADLNAGGGLRGLGGARVEALLGDAQSRPEVGASVVEEMMAQNVAGFTGSYSSAISLATTQTAAKQNVPFCLDGPTAQLLTERGLPNVFRLFPSNISLVDDALRALDGLNKGKGSPVKTAVLVHENGEFGTNTANLLAEKLPGIGIQVKGSIPHATPTRDFSNVALRIKSMDPDLVIITSYANEYVLIARALVQHKVDLAAIFSVSGAGFNLKFVKEQPTIASGIIDFNNWYNPRDPRSLPFRRRVETAGNLFTWEVLHGYFAVRLLADAIDRAGTVDRQKVNAALAASTYSDHFLPYGPTRFVNGQNTGAAMVALQALGEDIKVIAPDRFREVAPVFPRPKS
jgi:branched-chain amino acid transport system substrate-binding protein